MSVGTLRPVAGWCTFGGAGAAFDRFRPGKPRPTSEEFGGNWRSLAEATREESQAGALRRLARPPRLERGTPGLEGPSSRMESERRIGTLVI